MDSEFLTQLDTLVAFMRGKGIFRVKNGDFEVELITGWVPPVMEEVAKPTESAAESDKKPVRGKDGLTAEDQVELYGRVMDAKE